jgi:hypothetical protein
MTNIATNVKRLWLRRQYALTTAGGGTTFATLILALQAEAFKRLDAVGGGLVASTSARDRSVAFSNSDHGATTQDFAELGAEMLDLYEVVYDSIGGTPTDAAILDEMLYRLRPITETTNNYSLGCRQWRGAA